MARIVFTPESNEDLKNIIQHTKDTWGKKQTIEYISGLHKQVILLAQTPTIGKNRDNLEKGLICFPYISHIVYYTEISDGIAIIRFLHKHQDSTIHIGKVTIPRQ